MKHLHFQAKQHYSRPTKSSDVVFSAVIVVQHLSSKYKPIPSSALAHAQGHTNLIDSNPYWMLYTGMDTTQEPLKCALMW